MLVALRHVSKFLDYSARSKEIAMVLETPPAGEVRPFSLLTICTGNICRSPLAEVALADALNGLDEVRVSSAGSRALDGERMPVEARDLGERHGLDLPEHAATRLNRDLVAEARLILALAREHRSAAIALHPRASRYAFTLREFGRITRSIAPRDLAARLEGIDAQTDRLDAAVALAASRRGQVPRPADPADDDVVDPFRRGPDVYERCGRDLFPAAEAVADYLSRAALP